MREPRYYFTLIALAAVAPQVAAQCPTVPNTGSLANPSFNAGRCANEAGYCFLTGINESTPQGICDTTGRPGTWDCTCETQVVPYAVLNPGSLSPLRGHPGTQ